nr:haloalkane dehalogenase [Kineococcus siccus]
MTGERRTTTVDGLGMSTVTLGEGRPIVFLHGDVGQAYLWRNVLPYAAQAGRAIAVDLLGSGESDKLPHSFDGAYSFRTQYDYLSRLLDALGVTRDVVLVGHDWGANLAFEWAKDHPGAVAGVAHTEAVTPPFEWDDWTPPMIRPMFRTMHSDEGEAFQLGDNQFVENIRMGVLRSLSETELDVYRAPYRRPGEDRRPPLDWAREVPLGGRRPETAALVQAHSRWMADSDVPKLLLRAEPGALTAGRRLDLLRTWRNQQEVAVRGVHWPSEDDPHGIGRALLTWLEETVGR